MGRFLTPIGSGQNPYVPLTISTSLLGSLIILSAIAQRNRKRRKRLQLLHGKIGENPRTPSGPRVHESRQGEQLP